MKKYNIFSKTINKITSHSKCAPVMVLLTILCLSGCSLYEGYGTNTTNTTNSSKQTTSISEGTEASSQSTHQVEEGTYYLPVFETTDIHGSMVDISSNNEATYQYRLAYIANVINEQRQKGDLLLLDTGDAYQGNVLSNQLLGQPIKAYYGVMNYDAICVGNHEFDWGLTEVLGADATIGAYELSEEYKGYCETPIVCANLYEKSSGARTDLTRDYVIVTKKALSKEGMEREVRIAIFGYVEDYTSSISEDKVQDYYIVPEDIEQIKRKASEMEASGEVDATVLNCHVSPETMDELLVGETCIDLVACGHSHNLAVGKLSNGVPYFIGGSDGAAYASATLVFERDTVTVEDLKTVSITQNAKRLYDNEKNTDQLDPTILAISQTALKQLNSEGSLMSSLGYITESLTNDERTGHLAENLVTTWAAQRIAEAVGADVGAVNSTGVRTTIQLSKKQNKKDITGADIYSMFPFDNHIVLFSFTYEDLLQFVNQTQMNEYSFIGLSGVDVYYDNQRKAHTVFLKDQLIYNDGWVEDRNTKLIVALDGFIASFENKCYSNMTPIETTEALTKDMICNYLINHYGEGQEIPVDTRQHMFFQKYKG